MNYQINPTTTPEQLLHDMGHAAYPESIKAAQLALQTNDPEFAMELMIRGLENTIVT